MGEMMDFWNQLNAEANKRTWCKNSFWRKRRQEGIDAAIEALKEMMVGKPMKVWATWGAGHNTTKFWDVEQLGNLFGLPDGGGTRFTMYAFATGMMPRGSGGDNGSHADRD